MSARIVKSRRGYSARITLQGIAAALILWGGSSSLFGQEQTERLIDQQPFDRITLNEANGNEVIDVLLLDIPNRSSLSKLPTEGNLELRRVSEPSTLYTAPWDAIAKIELYEQLLLNRAVELIGNSQFDEAYSYLEFLHNYYPTLAGLKQATEQYLALDARNSFSQNRYDESLSILLSLYDLNPQHNKLAEAVESVADRLISQHLTSRDFAAARSVVDLLETSFPNLELGNVATWRQKFAAGAQRQIEAARKSLAQGDYADARQALRRATAILPTVDSVRELNAEIDRLAPQLVVGVSQHATAGLPWQLSSVASTRVARLTDPRLIELNDFGAEGGIYSSRWADLAIDDSGLHLAITLSAQSLNAGITPAALALRLVRMADPNDYEYREDFAGLLQNVSLSNGREVLLQWRWPHVRPEALLQLPIRELTSSEIPGGPFQLTDNKAEANLATFQPPRGVPGQQRLPSIVERAYPSEEAAITDLVRGEIDVLERVAPWQVERLRQTKKITTASYRLPTIHVLLPNYGKPLMNRREFRRALCYGIDRQRIMRDIILDGRDHPGFLVLSGPVPAGRSLSDPIGYAYQREIKPRPYEPRLAAVLATVARTSLKKPTDPNQGEDENDSEAVDDQEPAAEEVQPLILTYPPDPIARTTCQTIKLQLDAVGIPLELQELPAHLDGSSTDYDYDLRYIELPLWEPLVDLRRLLGPKGLAGFCSPAMSLALKDVDQARNWKEARTRLNHVHEVAYYDLPVIPLWQTVNTFAYRSSIAGIGESPVSLYQNVDQWKH